MASFLRTAIYYVKDEQTENEVYQIVKVAERIQQHPLLHSSIISIQIEVREEQTRRDISIKLRLDNTNDNNNNNDGDEPHLVRAYCRRTECKWTRECTNSLRTWFCIRRGRHDGWWKNVDLFLGRRMSNCQERTSASDAFNYSFAEANLFSSFRIESNWKGN